MTEKYVKIPGEFWCRARKELCPEIHSGVDNGPGSCAGVHDAVFRRVNFCDGEMYIRYGISLPCELPFDHRGPHRAYDEDEQINYWWRSGEKRGLADD